MSRSPFKHRLALAAGLAFTALVLAQAVPARDGASDPIRQTLEQARASGNRSVTVHMPGGTVAVLVTAVDGPHVIGRSAQHERIVIRIDRIDAVAF